MIKKYVLPLIFLCFFNFTKSQVQLSVYSEVSIITAGSGSNLYEAFGHSAIRIKDPVLQLDVIYNYGIFDFNSPNFYINFIKGDLLYSLGKQNFNNFVEKYNYQKRWVKQQVLNLNQQEKQDFFLYLENNAQLENRNYSYDPYFNNCATKLRDITSIILKDKLIFNDINDSNGKTSLRSLMEKEIPWNTWGSFGINLALGAKLDKEITENQYMYLPKYVYQKFKAATIEKNIKIENLIKKEVIIVDHKELKYKSNLLSPFLIFSIISLIGIFITYRDYKLNKRTKWLDFTILFTTGFIGLIILFLWLFTNHSTAPNNFNFLWAFAPNLFIAFVLLRKKSSKFISLYFKIKIFLLIIMMVIWVLGIQFFPLAILPFTIFLFLRYLYIHKQLKSIH